MADPEDLLARLVEVLAPLMDSDYCSPYLSAWELTNYGDYGHLDGEMVHEQVRQAWEAAKRHIEGDR